MKISQKAAILALCLHVFSCNGQAMEMKHASTHSKPLDDSWPRGVKLSEVIGLTPEENVATPYDPLVCVVDTRVNPQSCFNLEHTCVFPLTPPISNQALDPKDNHGSHVANTILEICPHAKILSSNFQTADKLGVVSKTAAKIAKAAENPHVDIINLSLGKDISGVSSHMTETCPWYQAILTAVRNGKIVIKALGNDHGKCQTQAEEDYIRKVEALYTRIKNDETIKGRFIVVGNSQYYTVGTQRKEGLNPSSVRSQQSTSSIITAPGTNITARIDQDTYGCYSGTSMATPIVSGIIARLLREYKTDFETAGIEDIAKIRSMIADFVLNNARHHNFFTSIPLDPSFGQGVVNYRQAKQAIISYLNPGILREDETPKTPKNGIKSTDYHPVPLLGKKEGFRRNDLHKDHFNGVNPKEEKRHIILPHGLTPPHHNERHLKRQNGINPLIKKDEKATPSSGKKDVRPVTSRSPQDAGVITLLPPKDTPIIQPIEDAGVKDHHRARVKEEKGHNQDQERAIEDQLSIIHQLEAVIAEKKELLQNSQDKSQEMILGLIMDLSRLEHEAASAFKILQDMLQS